MLELNFSQNWNGKLFLDHFPTVRLHNPQKYAVDNLMEVKLKNTELGIVKVVAIRTFFFKDITDVLSYYDMGKPAHYMAQVMKNMYAKHDINQHTKLDHIILQYTSRYLQNWEPLLKEWWQNKIDIQANAPIKTQTLFS